LAQDACVLARVFDSILMEAGTTNETLKVTSQQKRDFLWCCASLFLLYSIGGLIFSFLERESETKQYARNQMMYDRMQELYKFSHCDEPFFAHMDFCKNQQRFDERFAAMFERSGNTFEDQQRWTFLGSVFFVNSLVTTIGYGSMYPRTAGGMIFTIVFGILGIPTMAYALRLLATIAIETLSARNEKQQSYTTLAIALTFIFGGSVIYIFLEPWNYFEAIYFCVITLTSIGFGDYMPSHAGSRIFTVFFVILGLGTVSACIQIAMTAYEFKTTPLTASLGKSYATFIEDCDICVGERPRPRADSA